MSTPAPAKKVVKAKSAAPPSHPTYSAMIRAAVKALADKKGSSRAAIVKYVSANYKLSGNVSVLVRQALKRMTTKKELVHASSKSQGANGSFKLPVKLAAAKKPKATKKPKSPKKPAVKKAKSPAKPKAKSVAKPKKSAVLNKPKSPAKKASPKKKVTKNFTKKVPAKK